MGALTEWVGRDTLSLTIDFRMGERAREDEGMELRDRIRSLEQLAGVDIDDPEPPLFSVTSTPEALIPHNAHHASQNKFFMDSLTWEKSQFFYNSAGNPITCGGTMVISVFTADENLSAAHKARKGKGKKGARRKTYKVKPGDTLQKIAARKDVYGDSRKWKKIADANKIRDPKNLKVGSTLKIP
jgi:LysM repeat protein